LTLEEAKRYLLEKSKERKIAVEVLGQRDRELSLKAREGRLEEITQATQGGIGARVVSRERVGYAFSEQLTPEALDWMLNEAIENAALQHEARGFLPDGVALGFQDLAKGAFDAPIEAKAEVALEFEASLRKDPRVKNVLIASYTEREREVRIGSTQRADGGYRHGLIGITGSMVMADGESRKQAWDSDWSRQFSALDPGRTALELVERTGRLLNARPLQTGRHTAYFEPKALTQLLAAYWWLWNGRWVLEGKSRFSGKLDQSVASPLVTLVDDPMLPEGLLSRPFDAEGTPTQRLALVDRGVLRNYLLNSETAQQLGMKNTGNAARQYSTTLNVWPSNLFLQAGAGARMKDGVIVADLMGVHAGANPISGEFSVQAFGLFVKGGEIAYPVENFAVAGDFLTLLRNITAVGDTLEWHLMGMGIGAPLVEVQDLSFAGT
jgi:PmbA protein